MTIYAVYCPKKRAPVDVPERLRFIPERPSFWAFVVPPLWLLLRRAWLGLVLWLLAVIALAVVTQGMADDVAGPIWLAFWVWFAVSARDLQQAELTGTGWALVDVVEAPTRAAAERRYFDRAFAAIPVPAEVGPAPVRRPAAGVIGFEGFEETVR